MTQRHKVFVSYHHANDQVYRDNFEQLFANHHDVIVSKSVQIGDIDPNLKTETVRQKIRDEYLRDSTVTVVLIGEETWKRKHVDWEIAASIRNTKSNARSGLIGIILPKYDSPTFNDYLSDSKGDIRSTDCITSSFYNKHTVPPRLSNNIDCSFAKIYNWSDDHEEIQSWIHEAFLRRSKVNPDNSYPSFVNNRSGERWY